MVTVSVLAGIFQAHLQNKKIESDLAMGEKIMYYSQIRKIVSIIAAIFMIGLSIFLISLDSLPKENGFIWFLVLVAIFLLVSIYWALESFFVKITFDDQEIVLESPWRQKRRVLLSELTGYKYSEDGNYHVFTTERKGKIHLSPHLKGLTNFFILLDKKKNELNERLLMQLRFGNISD